MATPNWIAATPGQPPLAQQVNQLLVTHAVSYVYTGVEQDHQATAGSGAVNSNGLWIAERFTPSTSYTTGRIVLTLAVTGSPSPLVLGIYSNVSGAPGSLLAGPVSLPPGFVGASAAAVSVPIPGLAVASGTSYWIVAQATGDASDYFSWSKANGALGAATSPDGVTWTAQSYNLLFQVWDATAVPPLVHTYSDAGARWTSLAFNASSLPTSLEEYTAGQSSTGWMSSVRSLTYSGANLTSVA